MSTRAGLLSRLLRAPAMLALGIQLTSFCLTAGLAWLAFAGDLKPGLAVLALVQGGIAAAIARWLRMAPWWIPIHIAFPVGAVFLLAAQLPSWLYLAAFLSLAALYWTTFRTQVPFFPSDRAVWAAVAALLPANRPFRLLDMGSGLGGMLVHLASARPDGDYTGIEIAPLPWLVSRVRLGGRGGMLHFLRGDYEAADLGNYDIVFAYLSPAAMPALWAKAQREMQPGSLLLSLEFPVPGVPSHDIIHPSRRSPALYLWRF